MFADSADRLEFRDKILAAMAIETETWDLLQLCELAKELALAGDSIAADRLADRVYQHAEQPSDRDWIGANELIAVRGMDAVLELSRIYGRRLLTNSDDFVNRDLAIFTDRSQEIVQLFDRYATMEESIATYYQYLIDREVFIAPDRQKLASASQSNRISIETILDKVRSKQYDYPQVYASFGCRATGVELAEILNLLSRERDEEICLRLVWIFWRTPLPRLVDCLFGWVDSHNKQLRIATIKALSQISDRRVYELARMKVANYQLFGADIKTIDLFIHNYHLGDAELIFNSLNNEKIDNEDLVLIGCSIIALSEKEANPELSILLAWMYDRTPCSCCRSRAVKQLQQDRQLPDRILTEYQFDSTKWDK